MVAVRGPESCNIGCLSNRDKAESKTTTLNFVFYQMYWFCAVINCIFLCFDVALQSAMYNNYLTSNSYKQYKSFYNIKGTQ